MGRLAGGLRLSQSWRWCLLVVARRGRRAQPARLCEGQLHPGSGLAGLLLLAAWASEARGAFSFSIPTDPGGWDAPNSVCYNFCNS